MAFGQFITLLLLFLLAAFLQMIHHVLASWAEDVAQRGCFASESNLMRHLNSG